MPFRLRYGSIGLAEVNGRKIVAEKIYLKKLKPGKVFLLGFLLSLFNFLAYVCNDFALFR